MLEILVQLLGELLFQIVGEILLELGMHALAEPFERPPNPWLAALGYTLFGAIVGGLSLWMLPHHLTPAGAPRLLNLLFTPVIVGGVMSLFGAWRRKRGEPVLRIDRFSYGYLFALTLALVRFKFAV